MANYDTRITIRFSKNDRDRLLKKANGKRLSLSAFIRTTLLHNTNVEDQQ